MTKLTRSMACGVVLIATLCAAGSAAAATAKYPDLKTLQPRLLRFDTVDVGGGDTSASGVHDVLRFSNTVWNAGPGKLVLRGALDPATLRGPAYQRVYDDTGAFTEVNTGGVMYYHPSHDHYHFEDWGQFQLWTAANYDAWVAGGRTGGVSAQAGSKTTSCVLDEEFVAEVLGSSWPGVFGFAGCNPNDSGDLMEGLSPGWGDTYDWWRADQWIDLGPGGKLADGDYVLRSVVDPTNKIFESPDRSDATREDATVNDAVTRFSVRSGRIVDLTAPTGTVTIANAQASTETTKVTVRSLGRDDVAGVDQYRVSNDGTSWATFTYDGIDSTPSSINWDLADARYGGNANLGTKTVYVQFHDSSGKWGPTQTDTIELKAPPAQSPYAQGILNDGPVSYWRLGDTSGTSARDERSANPGVYVNGPALGSASLIASDTANKAVGFDGARSYMKVGPASSLNLGSAITLEAWIKPTTLPTAGRFASVVTKPEAYSLQFNGPQMEFTVIQNGVRKRRQAPAGTIVAGRTYHVVGTYDGTTQKLYVNGAEVASGALSGPASTTSTGLFVGSWDGAQEFLNGTIDDVAVYGKTLSAAQVKAHYDAGQAAPAAQPPAAPTNLAANAVSPTRVDLTWSDNSSDESSFVVQRSTDAAFTAPTQLNVANDKTSFSDTGVAPGTAYWYRIRSRNAVGVSDWSNVATVTTPQSAPATPPAAPSGTAAIAVSSSRIDVSWTDNSSDETSFVVERSATSAFTTVQSASVPAGTTTFSDTGLSPSTAYWYRVKAVNAAGSSAASAAATATTQAAPTGYASEVTSDAPVSYWRLGETSGTAAGDARAANPGTYRGGPALGAPSLLATDQSNRAVGFDGLDDSVSVADSNSLDLTSGIAVEAWIKPNLLPAAGQFASIVTKPEAYSLQFNGGRLEFTVIQNGARRRLQAASGAIVGGQTYHVVGTFDGTTQRLYVNGSQAVSAPLAGPATVTPSNLAIGSWDGSSEFMNGTIDDVAVYNQPLSATRVTAHYDAGRGSSAPAPPAAPSGLVAGAVSSSQIDMSWADNSADETSFVVERSGDSSFSAPQSTTLPAGTTSFSDTGRAANTQYWYRVKAVNAAGSSAYSNVATATTKPVQSSYAATVTGDAPVSYWRLGETSGTAAADQRGANPGSYRGSPGLGAAGLVASDTADRAVSLDGLDDTVAVADSSSLDLTSGITAEAWIKPSLLPASGSFASIVTKPEAYSLQVNGGRLEFTVMQNGARRRLQAAAGAIVAGRAYHVVGTFDGATQRLYVNGSQVASQALAGTASVTTSGLWIGSWDGFSERFTGVIDDVAIYNRALSAGAVSAHYSAAQAPTTTTTATALRTTSATQSTQTTTTSTSSGTGALARIGTTTAASRPESRARARKHRAHRHRAKRHRAKRHARHRTHRHRSQRSRRRR